MQYPIPSPEKTHTAGTSRLAECITAAEEVGGVAEHLLHRARMQLATRMRRQGTRRSPRSGGPAAKGDPPHQQHGAREWWSREPTPSKGDPHGKGDPPHSSNSPRSSGGNSTSTPQRNRAPPHPAEGPRTPPAENHRLSTRASSTDSTSSIGHTPTPTGATPHHHDIAPHPPHQHHHMPATPPATPPGSTARQLSMRLASPSSPRAGSLSDTDLLMDAATMHDSTTQHGSDGSGMGTPYASTRSPFAASTGDLAQQHNMHHSSRASSVPRHTQQHTGGQHMGGQHTIATSRVSTPHRARSNGGLDGSPCGSEELEVATHDSVSSSVPLWSGTAQTASLRSMSDMDASAQGKDGGGGGQGKHDDGSTRSGQTIGGQTVGGHDKSGVGVGHDINKGVIVDGVFPSSVSTHDSVHTDKHTKGGDAGVMQGDKGEGGGGQQQQQQQQVLVSDPPPLNSNSNHAKRSAPPSQQQQEQQHSTTPPSVLVQPRKSPPARAGAKGNATVGGGGGGPIKASARVVTVTVTRPASAARKSKGETKGGPGNSKGVEIKGGEAKGPSDGVSFATATPQVATQAAPLTAQHVGHVPAVSYKDVAASGADRGRTTPAIVPATTATLTTTTPPATATATPSKAPSPNTTSPHPTTSCSAPPLLTLPGASSKTPSMALSMAPSMASASAPTSPTASAHAQLPAATVHRLLTMVGSPRGSPRAGGYSSTGGGGATQEGLGGVPIPEAWYVSGGAFL